MFCSRCGKAIEHDSRFCRYCGAEQPLEQPSPASQATGADPAETPVATSSTLSPKPGSVGKIVAAVIVILVVLIVIGSTSKSPDAGKSGAANLSMTADNVADILDSPAAPATDETKPIEPENWSYSTDEDKVRGATTYFAATTSKNSIHQDPPYDAATTMTLTVRKHPAYGTDVLLSISSGQMMCPSYEGCSGTVRFDDGPAREISFNGPADSSSDTIFVRGAPAFIAQLKKAKRLVIEKTLYEAGNPQFEFDVRGLRWEH